MSEEPLAPGWDAITTACDEIYPGQEPKHFGTIIKYAVGGPDPIDGISIYAAEDPVPHWHYVTYGFSELYEKESENPEFSGYGFELTFRLARGASDDEPPVFAANFLQNLARYVFSTGNVFEPGEHIDFNGPIEADAQSAITAGCFVEDPELGEIDTANGVVKFVQVVGITADELVAINAWNTYGVLELLARKHGKWVTDTSRGSILEDVAVAEEARSRSVEEGSSTGMLYTRSLEFERDQSEWRVRVGALEMRTIAAVLPARLLHGRDLMVSGQEKAVVFRPRDACDVEPEDDGVLTVSLSEPACAALVRELRPERGDYRVPEAPLLVIEVVPTEIRNGSGEVVEVVG